MPESIIPEIDLGLLARYDKTGPRYTSYPTAPQFTPSFTGHDFLKEIRDINPPNTATPLSLYLHLPFCESVCFFCACNVTFTADHRRPDPYIETVKREMDTVIPLLAAGRRVVQLHWGGGMPNFFSPDQMRRLHEATRARFAFAPNAEVALEVDPRDTTSEHLRALQELGFNRISIGIQDFDPDVQKAVNRVQSEEVTRRVMEEARQRGFTSISVDLIYGLPFQKEDTFARTLDRIVALNPDRVAVFNFAYLPEVMRHQKAIPKEALPSPAVKLAILKRAIVTFTQAGYRYIGMDHFARPVDELCLAQDQGTLFRNFQGYTTYAGCDLHAFGVSSISQVGRVYAQNHKNIHDYEALVKRDGLATVRGLRLTEDDAIRREAIMQLMCHFALDKMALGRKFGIPFDSYFASALKALEPMEADGLLRLQPDRIAVTPTGRLLIRNICMAFDAYLDSKSGARFSRTV
jgi:oxygen-independent coproporphyrinogen-3 oxidase